MSTILGIDCGFAAPGFAVVSTSTPGDTGYGIVLYAECFRTKALTKQQRKESSVYKSNDDARRCIEVSDKIERIVSVYKPDIAVIELPSAGAKSSGAIRGMALGAATTVVTLHRLGVAMRYITPGANKKGSTTDRNAEKEAVIAAVRKVWPSYAGWPKLKRKDALDISSCEAVADALSAVYTNFTT